MTEGYQYSQLSPSRSPSGPTYTQLSSGARTPATQQYHAVTTVPNNPGKFSSIYILFYHVCQTFHCAKLHTVVNSKIVLNSFHQVCGVGSNSIRRHSQTGKLTLKSPHNHRTLDKPGLVRSRKNYPTCCRCYRTKAVRPASKN